MMQVEELWQTIDSVVQPLAPIRVELQYAHHRVLAEPILADLDQPAFDRSSIDGFAVRIGQENTHIFNIIGEILPGQPPPPPPPLGDALRIFTGSATPPDTALIMVEDTEVNEDQVHLKKTPNLTMIRRKGSVTRSGDCLLPVNTLLKAGELSLLASTGAIKPLIIPLPHALHITTGSEVVPPSATPALGQIRDTNSALIRALLEDAVVQSLTHIHVDESVAMLVEKIQKHPFDLLIISGGSSVGEYDRTHEALIQGGFHIHCHKVAVKPGKPLIFAQRDNQYALGFPGNPVSHFVTFHLFAMRILARLTGRHPQRFLNSILGKGANMKSDQRETFWPARMDHTALVRTVVPMPWLDSGDLTSLRNIDALIRIPSNHPALKEGDSVQIIVL